MSSLIDMIIRSLVPEKNNSDSDNVRSYNVVISPLEKTSKSFDSRMTGYIKLKLAILF